MVTTSDVPIAFVNPPAEEMTRFVVEFEALTASKP